MMENMIKKIQDMITDLKKETYHQIDHLGEKWQNYKTHSKEYYHKWSESARAEIEEMQKETEAAFSQMKHAQDQEKERLRQKIITNLERLTTYLKK